ncbi:hypothetical protein [Spongiactinospora sp. 9N601]|uniref:hypothetical protein n=1 Tax=Spongiactinospora sp. 9N601 TaxID=3375149 RepID=UPI00379DFEEE
MLPAVPRLPRTQRRRRRAATARPHQVGFKLSDDEHADVSTATEPTGPAVGAYAAQVVTVAARQEPLVLPVADRDRIAELIQARAELARAAALLTAAERDAVLPVLTRAARRIE